MGNSHYRGMYIFYLNLINIILSPYFSYVCTLGFSFGRSLTIGLGVATGTAIYHYFNQPAETPPYGPPPHNNALERRSANENCTICWSRLSGDRDGLYTLRCGHTFHHRCMEMWLNIIRICPTCEVSV
ncbi:zinc finger protein [Oryctes borbonicus]|uniref:Zinc finger protein n=1 Tax=Oryctes borbonicus TaxID=1629725 RepID=A0A0T6AU43_9SCAR|nr:zinc finger protein [Oryctes borbonicus]